MEGSRFIVPKEGSYEPILDLKQTQAAVFDVERYLAKALCDSLDLTPVPAPLFVQAGYGLNDDLNGVERKVTFDISSHPSARFEVVQSLAKWKRVALSRYDLTGLLTRMTAIRRDEDVLDNLHSLLVDQFDWERRIQRPEDRTDEFLQTIVRKIYRVLKDAWSYVWKKYPSLREALVDLPEEIFFVSSEELELLYPDVQSPREREHLVVQQHKAVFLSQIGGLLPKSGVQQDGRAPDYDDWKLNGDILVWCDLLQCSFELSSMGIRVDAESLKRQLEEVGQFEVRKDFPYHQGVLSGELPLTIGGGIGISRSIMLLLCKAHIGEVQCGFWPEETKSICAEHGIPLL